MKDSTAIIQQKITDAANTTLVAHLEPSIYDIVGRLIVPAGVDFFSEGNCRLKGWSTEAGVSYSERGKAYASIPRGGNSHGITIDGNNIAVNPLFIGFNTSRSFENMSVFNSPGIGIIAEELQNSWLSGIKVSDCKGGALMVNLTCRTVTFGNCIFSGADKYGVLITQTGTPINAGGNEGGTNNPACSKINFMPNCLIERTTSDDAILIEAGVDLSFNYINTSQGGIKIRVKTGQFVDRVIIAGGEIQGKTCLEVKGTGKKINIYYSPIPNYKDGIISVDSNAMIT